MRMNVSDVSRWAAIPESLVLWYVRAGHLPFLSDSLHFDRKTVESFFPHVAEDGRRIPREEVLEAEVSALKRYVRSAVRFVEAHNAGSPEAERLRAESEALYAGVDPLIEAADYQGGRKDGRG